MCIYPFPKLVLPNIIQFGLTACFKCFLIWLIASKVFSSVQKKKKLSESVAFFSPQLLPQSFSSNLFVFLATMHDLVYFAGKLPVYAKRGFTAAKQSFTLPTEAEKRSHSPPFVGTMNVSPVCLRCRTLSVVKGSCGPLTSCYKHRACANIHYQAI